MSLTPSRPTKSTHTSSRWLPSRISSLAMLTRPSQSLASRSRLNFLLPLALVRSATIRKLLSWRNSVNPYRLEQPGVRTAARVTGERVPTTSRSARM